MHLSRVFRLDQLASPRSASPRPAIASGLLTLFAAAALAQSPAPAPQPAASAPVAAASRPQAVAAAGPASRPASRASGSKANNKQSTKPLWRELKPSDQIALSPLASSWDSLSVAQKRKWLALSKNYPKMTPDEQVKLHSRMTEWVALSPQQRAEARLNFAETRQLSPDDKKAKWEAYQALPDEEKRKLAAVAPKPPPTAPAVRPAPVGKLATIPKPKLAGKPTAAASAAGPASTKPLAAASAAASAPKPAAAASAAAAGAAPVASQPATAPAR